MKKGEKVALSLGGNLGDVIKTFQKAAQRLEECGLYNVQISSFYRTTPVGCPSGTPDFINGAIIGIWPYDIHKLFHLCKELEREAGRTVESPHSVSRPLDIDIIFFGSLIFSNKTLTIPHKGACERLFVLIPLAEIAGKWIVPGYNSTVNHILSKFKNNPEYSDIISRKI